MQNRDAGYNLSGEVFTVDPTRKRIKGLIKIGEDWFHLSEQFPTLVLRPLSDGEVDGTSAQRFSLDNSADKAQAEALLANATFYSGWSINDAAAGRDRILGNYEAPTDSDPASRIVPITRLRNFYEILRSFGTSEPSLALLEAANRRPDELDKILGSSFKHFSRYNNPEEPFLQPGKERKPIRESGFAKTLLLNIREQQQWTANSDLAFDYVEYELSPIRTTQSRFEDGRPAKSSGAGGIDLLLRSHNLGLPIIGEIKAKNDTNLFLALIQSLTYAVELSTPAQRRRLNNHQGFDIGTDTDSIGPLADVYLMYEDGTDPKIKDGVFALAEKLRKIEASAFSRLVRTMAFLEFKTGDPASLQRTFIV